jgi:hypothetical protein
MGRRLEHYFDQMAETLGGDEGADDQAVANWCTMIGAVMLSRVLGRTGGGPHPASGAPGDPGGR